MLQAHPKAFLNANVLRCAGHPTANGLAAYVIQNNGGVQNEFDVMPGFGIPNAWGFTAYSVVMQPSTGIVPAALVGLALPNAGGPDLMITGILNGCTFCILGGPNQVQVAHVRPVGRTAHSLQTLLAVSGRFAGSPHAPIMTFGQATEYTGFEDATVVGVRKGGRWKIYAQIHNRTQWDNLRVQTIFAG